MINITAAKINKGFFNIEVNSENYSIIRSLLERERQKIIVKLKNYKAAGFINSIFKPRNKSIQDELDDLVKKKKILKYSISQINKIFK